jgi:glycosyltransferase involved in cell wall biosynthesis
VISVVCCTYNRDLVFEDTVRSFLDCGTDGIEHELLLIDNNSTDKTREIGEGFGARYPGIRYMNEPSQGHPLAKNRGIRESRGEIVAFVDDDVFFVSGWLKALASTFERHPEIACIGGKVVPHFEAERPPWLEDEMLWIYGVTRYGDLEKEIRFPDIPIGCNMAFRRAVFEKIGDFHMSLGRKPGILLSGDEDHFLLRAERAGLKTLYAPEIRVSHRVPPARLTRDWVLSRFYWAGVSEVAMRQLGDDPLSRGSLTKKAIRTLHNLLRQWRDTVGLLRAKNERNSDVPIIKQADVCHKLGTLRQMVAEAAAVPDGNAACSGRPARDK